MTKSPPGKSKIRAMKQALEKIDHLDVSEGLVDRVAISGDLSGTPFAHFRWKKRCLPDLVALPGDTSALRELMRAANHFSFPVTVRGGGSTFFGESVPAAGGIVVDMKRLRHWDLVQEDDHKILVVQPGCTFNALQTILNRQGLELPMLPCSGPSATVGGWFANGGIHGLGTFQRESFLDVVTGIKVITGTGEQLTLHERDEMAGFFGTQGTLGVISELKLHICPETRKIPLLFEFRELDGALASISALSRDKPIYFARVSNYGSLPGETTSRQEPSRAVHLFLILNPEGADPEPSRTEPRDLDIPGGKYLGRLPSRLTLDHHSGFELQLRQSPGIIPMYQNIIVPLEQLPAIISLFEREAMRHHLQPVWSAIINQKGGTRLTLQIPTPKRAWNHFLASKGVLDYTVSRALESGYQLASVGLLNAYHFRRHCKEKLQRYRAQKTKWDPREILNPLKIGRTKISPLRVKVMFSLARLWKRLKARGRHIWKDRNRSVALDLSILRNPRAGLEYWTDWCVNCNFCREVCPSYAEELNEKSFAGGRLRLLRTYLEQGWRAGEDFYLNFTKCTTCGACQAACPLRIPMPAIFEALRAALLPRLR